MDDLELIKAYKAGESLSTLLRRFKIGHVKLSRLLAVHGVEPRGDCSTKLSEEQVLYIVEQYKTGCTVDEIMERFHIGEIRVHKLLKAAGCEIRSRGEAQGFLPLEVAAAICNEYDRGSRISEIAKKYVLSRVRVLSLLRRRGLYQKEVTQYARVAPCPPGMHQCSACGETKPDNQFVKNEDGSSRKVSHFCKACRVFASRRCKYGVTREDYERMLQAQHRACAICGATSAMPRRQIPLYIDHSHTTGAVRKLLCHNCNALLGHARDSRELLRKAEQYLLDHGC